VPRPLRTAPFWSNWHRSAPIVSWLGELLESCPLLSILATSREVLRLKAEHVYALRPLDMAAAAALFVQRAQAVLPNFVLSGGLCTAHACSAIRSSDGHSKCAAKLALHDHEFVVPRRTQAAIQRFVASISGQVVADVAAS
jgi:hypothetical protein